MVCWFCLPPSLSNCAVMFDDFGGDDGDNGDDYDTAADTTAGLAQYPRSIMLLVSMPDFCWRYLCE